MTPEFLDAFNRCINSEGGYVNDPNDPGGETKFGISKRAYPKLLIDQLTLEDARNIYWNDYWQPLSQVLNSFSSLMFHTFDFAVNSSVQTALRYLQRTVNVADDGYIGPVTNAAIQGFIAAYGSNTLVMAYGFSRIEYMTKLKNWPTYGKGWTTRVCNNILNEFRGNEPKHTTIT